MGALGAFLVALAGDAGAGSAPPAAGESEPPAAEEPAPEPLPPPDAELAPDPPAAFDREEPDDTVNLETPVFPTYRVADAFRVRFSSRFLPSGAFRGVDVDLYEPALRLQATLPLSKRAALQIRLRGASSLYRFGGPVDAFGAGPAAATSDPVDPFFRTDFDLQAGVRLNEEGSSLLFENEIWSMLAQGAVRSRFEQGAFVDGLGGDLTVGLGYELPGRFRIGVGVSFSSALRDFDPGIGPVLTLRWRVTDRFTVRNRGRGVQLEYRLAPPLEIYAAGFLDGGSFRLDRRDGLPNDLYFRDDGVFAGAGFEWKLHERFRVNLEAGAVVQREIEVRSDELGTLFSRRADPGGYLDVRFEVRP